MEFPQYLNFKDYVFTILGYIDDTENFIEGKGYIDNLTGDIAIYKKSNEDIPKKIIYPLFRINMSEGINTKIMYFPTDISIKKIFNIKSLEDLSPASIIDNSNETDKLYDESIIEDMNSSNGLFVPTINPDDDFLKKIVKSIIISEEIDIKRLQHKFPQKHGLSNLKSVLMNKTKMSTNNFMIWMELLGTDFDIIIKDNGSNELNPLKKDLLYRSDIDKVTDK